ncbi:hemolysin family protein [Austwickia chelonae]|uniref:hemolysin family protein n=1 Tax=Austwickia chelonae TaxID=100225 RepID=UPI000E2821AF|nr:hemolysin family protein [Austwickia chelonae]
MTNWIMLLVAALLLLLNAFFVGAEFAVISARRSAIEPKAHAGSAPARVVLGAMEQVSLMLATAQLGITLASLGLGAVAEPALAHLIEAPFLALGVGSHLVHPVAFVLALLIVVYLHVVLGEMIPKNIALAGPDKAALWLVPPLVAVTKVLGPFVIALNALANGVLRLVKITPKDEVASAFTREQVQAMVDEAAEEGLLDDKEKALLAGALHFDEDTVTAALIPVGQVASVRLGQSCAEIETIAADTGYSRLPVLSDEGDGYIGYIHLKDVITADPESLGKVLLAEVVRPLPAIAQEASLRTLLEAMKSSQVHIAQVRQVGLAEDEIPGKVATDRGELRGIVTLEDVLGRLVGHIRAERG